MSKFEKEPLQKAAAPKAIDPKIIEQYKGYIEDLTKSEAGKLTFGPDEDMAWGRKALQQAGIESKKYIRVQKVRGEDNQLRFYRITKAEWDAARKSAQERGAKIRGTKRAKKTVGNVQYEPTTTETGISR